MMKSNPFAAFLGPALWFLTQIAASAHPGHYHPPGEGDEFDALRSNWLHLHGGLEISLAVLTLASVTVFRLSRRQAVRIGAACVFGGSVALIAAR